MTQHGAINLVQFKTQFSKHTHLLLYYFEYTRCTKILWQQYSFGTIICIISKNPLFEVTISFLSYQGTAYGEPEEILNVRICQLYIKCKVFIRRTQHQKSYLIRLTLEKIMLVVLNSSNIASIEDDLIFFSWLK